MLDKMIDRASELARIGLVAMLLLTFGPLVGQLSAAAQMPQQLDGWCGDAEPIAMHHDHHGADHEHAWYEQCEYCSLAQHFPFLSVHTPEFSSASSWVDLGPVVPVRSAFTRDALQIHAPNRAPPILIG